MGKRIKLVLCWHMHQPFYRDVECGQYQLPWVYLHAIKDYVDMAAHLEACPEAKAVINFVPILLEQIDDYQQQLKNWLQHKTPMNDPLLNLLAGCEDIQRDLPSRIHIVQACKKAHVARMIDPWPQYKQLLGMVESPHSSDKLNHETLNYLNPQYFIDLLVWYHLAWLGYTVRRQNPQVEALLERSKNYSSTDCQTLIHIMHEVISSLIPRYKKLAKSGQIELSMTPYAHPITPLLIDFESLHCATPNSPKPTATQYPGGHERAWWHIKKGLQCFKHYFAQQPKGIWLAEGAISNAAVSLLDEFNIQWSASGEAVWHNSSRLSGATDEQIHQKTGLFSPCQLNEHKCQLFFRDDGLSDLIGFQYKDWQALDAAGDFCSHLSNIAKAHADSADEHVVSIIMDGENAWEYYPDNAWHFLSELYRQLSQHPEIEITTFAEICKQQLPRHTFTNLCAGSWVYGSFSTWMGDEDKNRAWDYLVDAKQLYDKKIEQKQLDENRLQLASEQLAMCESSDWFWWFGDYNPGQSVQDFDKLYRHHLQKLYQVLGEAPPIYLEAPISYGGDYAENAGTMRKNS